MLIWVRGPGARPVAEWLAEERGALMVWRDPLVKQAATVRAALEVRGRAAVVCDPGTDDVSAARDATHRADMPFCLVMVSAEDDGESTLWIPDDLPAHEAGRRALTGGWR